MIPNIYHFIFGLQKDFGGKPFSFIHFLAVYTAWKINRPDRILFHYAFEPEGEWWGKAKPYLTLNKIEVPTEIFGNPVVNYAHRADIVRLRMLRDYGGIYLDLDVLCINPFVPLLQDEFVMGIQQNAGLCNAVILSKRNAPFLSNWLESYRNFDGRIYAYHSVELPYRLATENPALCRIVQKDLFFYPVFNDPVHHYLFGLSVPVTSKLRSVAKSIAKLGLDVVGVRTMKPGECAFHALRGEKWHYRKLRRAYCVHLWESLWWERYLASITPEYLLTGTSNLCLLLQEILGKEELIRLRANVQTQHVPKSSLGCLRSSAYQQSRPRVTNAR